MLLETIKANNFRNLQGGFELASGLNILFGENGQGKTNWLEAIAALASTRSFRTSRLQDAVRFGEEDATVAGNVRESAEIVRTLMLHVNARSKSVFINEKKATAQEYLGQLTAVVFNADELEIIRGTPEARRRFLDAGIVGLHPPFVQVFTDYNRVIKQKNALLVQARDGQLAHGKLEEMVAPWNEQLITLASKIHRARVRFVERINGAMDKRLFEREELSVKYMSALEGKGDLSDFERLLAERLGLRLKAEAAAGHSLIGPHRDDLALSFDGHDIRKFGSAGQQRSALLLLLLANISVFYSTRGEYPIFLLDDIDAELDYRRIGRLLEFLDGKCQTIVSTSKESFLADFGQKAIVYDIDRGIATKR